MKKITATLTLITIATAFTLPAYAEEKRDTAPAVPITVFVKGRQAIVNYLLTQVNAVSVEYDGRSVVAPENRYLFVDQLEALGYKHRGSFTELSEALAGMEFKQKVVPTPQGSYEVQVRLSLWAPPANDRGSSSKAFEGSGFLNISRVDGKLTAGEFQPWVTLNGTLAVKFPARLRAAKWLNKNDVGSAEDLETMWDSVGSTVFMPTRLIKSGYLAFADENGNAAALNIEDGAAKLIEGEQVVALLGGLRSSDIRSLRNPTVFDAGGTQFYRSGSKIYGRFPLLDVALDQGFKSAFYFQVPVWGNNVNIPPTDVFVTPIFLNEKGGGQPSGWKVGVEQQLQFQQNAGGWLLNVPPGLYHIRTEFYGVSDPEADPSPKG
jgi:hypothetical protein